MQWISVFCVTETVYAYSLIFKLEEIHSEQLDVWGGVGEKRAGGQENTLWDVSWRAEIMFIIPRIATAQENELQTISVMASMDFWFNKVALECHE